MSTVSRQLAQTKELIAGLAEDMKMKILDYDRPTVSPVEERRGTNFLAGLSEEQTKMFSGVRDLLCKLEKKL